MCPYCYQPIWKCKCVDDFFDESDEVDTDSLESPYLNPEQQTEFNERTFGNSLDKFSDNLRRDLEKLGPKERRVFELRFGKRKK